jgi:hypothetical protein
LHRVVDGIGHAKDDTTTSDLRKAIVRNFCKAGPRGWNTH